MTEETDFPVVLSLYRKRKNLFSTLMQTLNVYEPEQNIFILWKELQMIRFCVAQSQSCCYTFTLSTSSIPLSIYSLSMPLQLRLSSCPLASLSFYIPVSFPPSIRLSLAVSGDGCLCLLHLIWHFLHYCDQTDGKAIPKATGLLCRWLKAVLVAEVDFTFKLQATRDWCIQHSAAD